MKSSLSTITTHLLAAGSAIAITISKPGVPVLQDFGSTPMAEDISTSSANFSGQSFYITTAADLDKDVNAETKLNATFLSSALTNTASSPPTKNTLGCYNTTLGLLQTLPSEVKYSVIMATVKNGTGTNLDSLNITYDYSTVSNLNGSPKGAGGDEEIDGLRAYYSLSGNAGTWINIPSLSADNAYTNGRINAPAVLSATIDLSANPWLSNQSIYMIWVDDNGSTKVDEGDAVSERSFHIDNIAFTGGAAAPKSKVPAFVGLGLLSVFLLSGLILIKKYIIKLNRNGP